MPLFDVSKASTLGSTDLGRLTVKGLGVDLQAKLTESGLIQDKEAAVAVLIKVEGGKLQGTCWTLVGGLKTGLKCILGHPVHFFIALITLSV